MQGLFWSTGAKKMSPSRKPPDFVVLVNSLYIRIGLRDFYFKKSCKVLLYYIIT